MTMTGRADLWGRSALAVVLGMALVLGACGGDDDDVDPIASGGADGGSSSAATDEPGGDRSTSAAPGSDGASTAATAAMTSTSSVGGGSGGAATSTTFEWVPPESGSVLVETQAVKVAFAGFWSGDWGDLVMRIDPGGAVVAAYAHDEGAIVGRLDDDGVMRGWWCEVPSRGPDADAGAVEMRIVLTGGVPTIDGRWKYGDDPAMDWREDWDISQKSAATPPAELTARLDEATTLCVPPG
jgi:hypothetical protein